MATVRQLLEARSDGESGVRNLAKLCRVIGYKDSMHFGQFDSDGSYGDLINFLEDNPGAVEAVKDFITEHFEDEDEDEDGSA